MTRAILDTSVFIALETDRPISRRLPEEVAVSVITLGELETGVLVATDPLTRAKRLRTLLSVRALASPVRIDERTASVYAELAAVSIAAGRKPRVNDTWIAATAAIHGAEVWTQDKGFSTFDDQVTVVHV